MMASLSLASSAQTQGKLTGGIRYQMPEWFKESFLEIADDAIEAAEADKHLILFMHLNECPYCAKVLEESLPMHRLCLDSISLRCGGNQRQRRSRSCL